MEVLLIVGAIMLRVACEGRAGLFVRLKIRRLGRIRYAGCVMRFQGECFVYLSL